MKTIKSQLVLNKLNKLLTNYFKVPYVALLNEKDLRVELVDPELNIVLSLGAADGTKDTCNYRHNILEGDLSTHKLTAELVSSFLISGHAALTNLIWEKQTC